MNIGPRYVEHGPHALAYYRGWPETHYVYRAFDAAGRALYVGLTVNVARRLAEHRRESLWWEYAARFDVDPEPRVEAYARVDERLEIHRLRPVFNLGANHDHYDARGYVESLGPNAVTAWQQRLQRRLQRAA